MNVNPTNPGEIHRFIKSKYACSVPGELIHNHVPEESIIFLTRSESEVTSLYTDLGKYLGGFWAGRSARPPDVWGRRWR